MEYLGIPIDSVTHNQIRERWPDIQEEVIAGISREYPVYDGVAFKYNLLEKYVSDHTLDWPRLDSGRLCIDDDTFQMMALRYPEIAPLRNARHVLSQLRSTNLQVGCDGHNRCLLSPFRSVTGRNQPSTSKFVFGAPAWMRGLVQPKRGFGLAYLDYESQEFAIAAALSGDAAMQRAYTSGDPYLWFAQLVGAVPVGATKDTHEAEREEFKTLLGLAAMYQMKAPGLAWRLRSSVNYAAELLKLHRHIFAAYWKWQESIRDFAHLKGYLPTVYDWRLHVTSQTKDRTLTIMMPYWWRHR
jgi:hypothetical protein